MKLLLGVIRIDILVRLFWSKSTRPLLLPRKLVMVAECIEIEVRCDN